MDTYDMDVGLRLITCSAAFTLYITCKQANSSFCELGQCIKIFLLIKPRPKNM